MAKKKYIYISIMQLLIALHIDLMVTDRWLPFLPNDLGHNFSRLHYELFVKT